MTNLRGSLFSWRRPRKAGPHTLLRIIPGAILVAGLVLSGQQPAPASGPAAQYVIAVIGDYGCQPNTSCSAISGQQEIPIANMVHSWNPNAFITVGDNSYEDATSNDVSLDQQPYAQDVQAGIFFPIPGNHEWLTNPDTPTTNYFQLPNHYVTHFGNGLVDFFATDMNYQDPDGDVVGSVQANQYAQAVGASTAIWKITAGHQPFYSSGAGGTQTYTHWAILPAIDLFLSGHDHDMEHLVYQGQHYVVDGVGGKNTFNGSNPPCPYSGVSGSPNCPATTVWRDWSPQHLGAVKLSITPGTMTVQFWGLVSGTPTLLHSFTLTKPGTITGKVTDSLTGTGIGGATVSFSGGSTSTDATGNYSFSNVNAGTYSVSAGAAGYTGQSQSVTVTTGVSSANFQLTPQPGTIKGQVMDSITGKPVGGATISTVAGGVPITTSSDAGGNYTLPSLSEGSYAVKATATGYATQTQPTTVGAGATVTLNFSQVPLAGALTGRVTDGATAKAIAGATVSVTSGGGTLTAITNATGVYTLSVTEGTYSVSASATGYASSPAVTASVGPGSTTTQNVSLGPVPGSITGTVTDSSSGVAIAGATVSYVSGGNTIQTTTGTAGTYTLANVPEGSYTVSAASPNYGSQSATVPMGPGATVTQNFALKPQFGELSGQVLDALTKNPIAGATVGYTGTSASGSVTTGADGGYTVSPLASGSYTVTAAASGYMSQSHTVSITNKAVALNFSLNPMAGSISGQVKDAQTGAPIGGATVTATAGTQLTATTNPSGGYTFANLPEGTYSVTAAAGNYQASQAVSVSVGPGAALTQNFNLAPLSGSINGTVTDALTGSPISGSTVSAGSASATTSASGSYTIANLPPGTYNVAASATGYATQSQPATVTSSTPVTLNVALTPLAGAMSGAVTDAGTGTPISGATISATAGGTPITATSDATGAYALGNLTEGTYAVTVTAGSYQSATASLVVGPGATVTRNFALASQSGTISGKVTARATGSALPGVTVSYSGGTALTDAGGNYNLPNIQPGTIPVTAGATNYASQSASVVLAAGTTATQNFALSGIPIFADGFESGDLGNWTSSIGLLAQTTSVRSGAYAVEGNVTNGQTIASKRLSTGYTELYYRTYFDLKSQSARFGLLWARASLATSIAHLYVDTSNRLSLYNDLTAASLTGPSVSLGTWHSLELHLTINGTASTIEVWLDGVAVAAFSSTTANLGTTPVGLLQMGEGASGRTYDIVFDDVVVQATRIGQ